jgi:hypothetical protein
MKWPDLAGYLGSRKAMPASAKKLGFCTLAIHAPYRQRARFLCADLAPAPVFVLTDEPADFADLPVTAIRHQPTGPMAGDYLGRLPATGNNQGAAAYHDKRFAIQAALQELDTVFFLDADTRVGGALRFDAFPPGLAVTTVVRRSVAEHLETCGSWRAPAFHDLARELTGSADALREARWCHEACFAVTKDGREERFFSAWNRAADILQRRGVFSGEGGVIGLAAVCAGWSVNYETIAPFAALCTHEGGGPKAG